MATPAAEILLDAFSRVQQAVHGAVDGLSATDLEVRLDPDANTVGWLLWHLSRVQDDHIADAAGTEELWGTDGWQQRFGLDVEGIGFGHSAAQVARVRGFGPQLVLDYFDAVHARTRAYVATVSDDDLATVVDDAWDPPVTLGLRLVSVVDDCLQHAGQAAFVAGLLRRRG